MLSLFATSLLAFSIVIIRSWKLYCYKKAYPQITKVCPLLLNKTSIAEYFCKIHRKVAWNKREEEEVPLLIVPLVGLSAYSYVKKYTCKKNGLW